MQSPPATEQPFGDFRVPGDLTEFTVQGLGPGGPFTLGTLEARDEAHAAELARKRWPGVALFGRLVVV